MSGVVTDQDARLLGIGYGQPGLEGASKASRETVLWQPSMRSPDSVINTVKPLADARGRDSARNNGYTSGAVSLHKDGIIGADYRLNATPNWKVLSSLSTAYDQEWAQEFAQEVEAWFNLLGASEGNYLDAQGMNTFTGMLRLVIGIFLMTGEIVATAEWIRSGGRPCNTAIQLVSGDRLTNPNNLPDNVSMRRGIVRDARGAPLGYNIRVGDPLAGYADDPNTFIWRYVPVQKPWGRKQVIHIIEQQLPDQSRGISDMVAALKNMHMTKKYQEVTLQNAVINATYAAAIESELPNEAVAAALGANGGQNPGQALLGVYGAYMGALGAFLGDANNIRVEGAQIPHLFPGTKLNMQPVKTTGGVGTGFEESLLRHTAASLGLSYEEFSRDFSKTNYSSGRAALGVSSRFMASRKRHVADRFANEVYRLALEEAINSGQFKLPRGRTKDDFYAPLAKDAFCQAEWISSGSGQIDELKETQAAILRIGAGISTWQIEAARLGKDWRAMFAQRKVEEDEIKRLALDFDLAAKKPLGTQDAPTNVTDDGSPNTPAQPPDDAA
jgi:lambda family phage portal protein